MERRKVQRTGGSTYTVSLPKEWAENRLDFGDYLSIEKNDSYLKLYSDREEEKDLRASIKYDDQDHPIFRRTVALYLSGYDHINVVSSSEIESNLEEMVTENMVGMEVLKSENSRIEMKNLVKYEDLPFQQVLVRMDSLLKSMMEDIIKAIETGEGQHPEDINSREQEVDRMYLLGVRQLRKASTNPETLEKLEIKSESECVSLRVVLKSLERIGDHVKHVSKEIEEMDLENITEEHRVYLEEVMECYKVVMDALRKRDYEKAEEAVQKARSTPEVRKEQLSQEEFKNFRDVEKSMQRIKLLSDDIAEVVMNITVREFEGNIFQQQ